MPLPLIAAILLAASPVNLPEKTDACDLIEVNHYFDENGALLLNQILFWEWDSREARYQVRSWRLVKRPSMYPQACAEGFETTWREGPMQVRVTAPKFRETWTQYDPELIERKHLAHEERRELFTGKQPTPAIPPQIRDWIQDDPLPPAMEGME